MTKINASPSSVSTKGSIGVVVSWDFGFGKDCEAVSVVRDALDGALKETGFEPAIYGPGKVDDEDALDLARRVGWSAKLGIRQRHPVLKLETEDNIISSYGVMTATIGKEDASAQVGARVRINPHGGGFEVCPPLDGQMDPASEKVALAIADFAARRVNNAFNHDISQSLLKAVKAMGAIPMRYNGGGAYFMPSGPEADRVIALLDALEQLTSAESAENQFYAHVTVVGANARNNRTWSRNATVSFQQEIDELLSTLGDMQSKGSVRDSTWEKRKAECSALMVKADGFAKLLGSNLDVIKTKLAEVEKQFGSAQDHARQAVLTADTAFDRIEKAAKKTASKAEVAPVKKSDKPEPKKRASKKAVVKALDRI